MTDQTQTHHSSPAFSQVKTGAPTATSTSTSTSTTALPTLNSPPPFPRVSLISIQSTSHCSWSFWRSVREICAFKFFCSSIFYGCLCWMYVHDLVLGNSPTMDETNKSEAHLTSAAAFVEGGIQDACDDACSICLENFCDSDPSTMTSCKHEFHLQCVLEWCQRSSQCPMCWQPISLKDPTSQELLEAVEQERSFRINPARNSTIFRHPTLGDFELQHLPAGANDADLEERILQHLAAAAAMDKHATVLEEKATEIDQEFMAVPSFWCFSSHPNSSSTSPPSGDDREGEAAPRIMVASISPPPPAGEEAPQSNASVSPMQTDQSSPSAPQSSSASASQLGSPSSERRSSSQPVPNNQDRAGPSELQSFSDSLKSRFNAMSMRYKDSITKSTRGWKEKLFSRNTSMSDIGSEVRREVNAGIATVSRMMERLETRDARKSSSPESSNVGGNSPVSESNNRPMPENGGNSPLTNTNKEGPCSAESSSS